MDSKGLKHQNGNSVCWDEDSTSLKVFSERRKKSKLADFPKFFEIRPISGQSFFNFIFFSCSKRVGKEQ